MDITIFVQMVFRFIYGIIDTLNECVFSLYGYDVTLFSIMVVCLIFTIFANVWWKGAKG